jgi:prepilin-type processing-associated H-X9-DG protein
MPTSYVGIAGLGTDAPFLPNGHPRAGVFGYDRQTTLKDLKDGASCTMVVTESGRVRTSWLEGGPATVRGLDTADLPYIGPGRQFGGLHRTSGANVAFADGAVRFISDTIDPRIFEAISTIAGGEHVSPDALIP